MSSAPAAVPQIVLIILAIVIAPLAVFLKLGIGQHFWISLVCSLLFLLYPIAIIHALWVVLTQ
ncbi:MAG: YqaE/Pmp3 family membrane protein [Planctomycetota bacterium]